MKICKGWLQALLSPAPRGFAARSRVLARLASLAQIGELARRLKLVLHCIFISHVIFSFLLKRPPPESLKSLTPPFPWESDEFLQPVLPNDGLLQYGMSFFLLLYLKWLRL